MEVPIERESRVDAGCPADLEQVAALTWIPDHGVIAGLAEYLTSNMRIAARSFDPTSQIDFGHLQPFNLTERMSYGWFGESGISESSDGVRAVSTSGPSSSTPASESLRDAVG